MGGEKGSFVHCLTSLLLLLFLLDFFFPSLEKIVVFNTQVGLLPIGIPNRDNYEPKDSSFDSHNTDYKYHDYPTPRHGHNITAHHVILLLLLLLINTIAIPCPPR